MDDVEQMMDDEDAPLIAIDRRYVEVLEIENYNLRASHREFQEKCNEMQGQLNFLYQNQENNTGELLQSEKYKNFHLEKEVKQLRESLRQMSELFHNHLMLTPYK